MKLLKFKRIFTLDFLLIAVAVSHILFVIYLTHSIVNKTNNTTFARCRGFVDFNCIDIECMDIEIGCQLYKHKTSTHTLYSCD